MNKSIRRWENIIIFILIIIILGSNVNLSFAKSNTIYIDSQEDLIKFSKDAFLDTYFKGKKVVLRSDIDVSNIDSFLIPTFAGTFDGQGNTISGISIGHSGSIQGLFRYLQEDGIIKNLNISGEITPDGSKNIVGGLVGNNKGLIENCHFTGLVRGKNNVGGLVGVNEAEGVIKESSTEGNVFGEHFTGGIVGENLGSIFKSTNFSEVNISIEEPSFNLEDINWSNINSMENIKAHTDTGGIAGLSTGYIQDSTNRGPVGYQEMGYNVGGIVGRQSGHLRNCENYNTVLGRKDVGGIVGQVEPYLMLVFSEDTLQKLDGELDVLENILSKSFNNIASSSKSITSQIENIGESLNQTIDSMEVLSNEAIDGVDSVADTINIAGERIRYTLKEIGPILEARESFFEIFREGLDDIESGLGNLEITSDGMAIGLEETRKGIEDLRDAIESGDNALSIIERALEDFSNNEGDLNDFGLDLGKALEKLEESLKKGNKAGLCILNAMEDLELVEAQELEVLSEALESLPVIISKLNENTEDIIEAGISNITKENIKELGDIFKELNNASKRIDVSIEKIIESISKLKVSWEKSAEAFNDFSRGFNNFGKTSEDLIHIVSSLNDLIDSLVSEPNIELPNISSSFRQSSEALFKNIGDISSAIGEINTEVRDTNNNLNNDIEAASDQIFNIFNTLNSTREGINITDSIEDISEENIDENSLGTVYKNQNYGFINGAVNIGGIAGAMAVEYDLDPEDDIFKKGTPSINFKYLTSGIVKNCINHGRVEGKKDYIGGIVGRMDLGIVSETENYGDVESREGDYIGGIAGASYTSIDKSYALSSLKGENYIGGIAGYGKNISNSYSLIEIKDGIEWTGSIAGEAKGEISKNYYVHDELPGIDGISYLGKASPLTYDELLKVEGLPEAFSKFKLTFIANGKVLEEVTFAYGDSFDLEDLPDIPKKNDHDSQWEDFENTNMTFNTIVQAEYIPLKTVLSSNIFRDSEDLPLVLAEGEFTQDINLEIKPWEKSELNLPVGEDKLLESWHIELKGLSQEERDKEYTIRLLLPESRKKIAVCQHIDGRWEKQNGKVNGSYLIFPMKGSSGNFALIEESFSWVKVLVVFLILLGMFLTMKKALIYLKNKELFKGD